MGPLGHVMKGAVNHAIEVVDVDGVVRRIDVNNVMERIDVNHVVSRIDFNKVLSTINWDSQIERIDLDAILRRVDTTSIIAKSSTGMFSSFMDSLRTTVVLVDLYLWVVSRCRMWRSRHRRRCYLPPKPARQGHRQRDDQEVYPKGRTNKAVAVQGRYCGFVSKAIAVMMDVFVITILFAILFQIVQWSLILFLNETQDEAKKSTDKFRKEKMRVVLLLYCVYWFFYFFLTIALAGQTFGMMVMGLQVVNCRKSTPYSTVTVYQAFLRTSLLPITLSLFWPLGAIGVYRRDGRMLHDLVAQTGMIYLWDAKLAKVRRTVMREEHGSSVISDDDDSDAMDAYLNGGESDNEEDDAEAGLFGQEVVLGQEEGLGGTYEAAYSTFQSSGAHRNRTSSRI